jgi:transposase
MPAERTTMRQVREIVRLHAAGLSTRQIGIRVGVAASTVRLTLRRVSACGLSEPSRTGRRPSRAEAQARHAVDPVGRVHRAASRRVSLQPLLRALPGWEGRLSVTMRQAHAGGDKLFVDYAGDRCRWSSTG